MSSTLVRRIAFVVGIALLAFIGMRLNAAASAPNVTLDIGNVGPRDLSAEEQTQKAIVRDYAKAWKTMNDAASENRPDLLGDIWVGVAKDKLLAQIAGQKKSGITTKYVDQGHKLQALFYS